MKQQSSELQISADCECTIIQCAELKRGSLERLQAHYRVGAMVGDDKNCILEAIKVQIKSVEV